MEQPAAQFKSVLLLFTMAIVIVIANLVCLYAYSRTGSVPINSLFLILALNKADKNMEQQIAHMALVVADYDEAIAFYTQKLQFRLIEDTKLSDTKRWVMVAPPGNSTTSLLLAKAATEEQQTRIGNQTGGRVFLFLYTDDFWRDHTRMIADGISFVRPPVEEEYGIVAVFEDLYGNLWDLIQPIKK